MIAGDWTALEVTKLVVSALTPIVVVVIGVFVARTARRIEQAQWASRKVIERRLELYAEMAGPLNDLYCFFTLVGHFRDIAPPGAVGLKRQLDKVFHPNEFLMGTEFAARYREFMSTCFQTYTGFAQDAKLRSSPAAQRSERREWDPDWDRCFVSATREIALLDDVDERYQALMLCFAGAIGVPPATAGKPRKSARADERAKGDPASAAVHAHDEINRLLSRESYDAETRDRILVLLDRLGLLRDDEGGAHARLRQDRGRLVARRADGTVEVVASGRADWVGGLELRGR